MMSTHNSWFHTHSGDLSTLHPRQWLALSQDQPLLSVWDTPNLLWGTCLFAFESRRQTQGIRHPHHTGHKQSSLLFPRGASGCCCKHPSLCCNSSFHRTKNPALIYLGTMLWLDLQFGSQDPICRTSTTKVLINQAREIFSCEDSIFSVEHSLKIHYLFGLSNSCT